MDRGAWRSTVHGVAKSQTQLSDHHFPFFFPRQCLAVGMFYQAILHALSPIFHNPDFFKHENSSFIRLMNGRMGNKMLFA